MRLTVRVWQTVLFIVVALVAMLVLYFSVLGGVRSEIVQLAEAEQVEDAAALADALRPQFPLTVESLERVTVEVERFKRIFGDDVWVYDSGGRLVESQATLGLPQELLDEAWTAGLAANEPFASVQLDEPGLATASMAVLDEEGRRVGAVVVVEPTADIQAVLEAAEDELFTAFWIALAVAALIGLVFSDFISRRVRALSTAAIAISDGDFDQRLPKSLVPDEVGELADAYNKMAERLGIAFASVREREQEINAVVESMGEGVVAVDTSRCVTLVNEASAQMLMMRAEDLKGNAVEDDILDDDVLALIDQGLTGETAVGTVTLGRSTLELHCAPIRGDGRTEGAVLLMRDVTERIRWEQAQRRFIADASHEMRTPIAAMKGFLELLQSGAEDDRETRTDFLETMRVEVERLSRLVAELFTLAQLDAGRLKIDMKRESLSRIVEDVISTMRPIVDGTGVSLETDLSRGRLCVLCDRDRVVQVLVGLVDNAVKYAGEGQTVTLRARVEGEEVAVQVSDTGPGILADDIPLIFDRFYTAKGKSQRPRGRGAGLGLSIAKEIVEAHDSRLYVTSRTGEGTTFTFALRAVGGCSA